MGKHSKKHKIKDDEPKTRTLKKLPQSSPPTGRVRSPTETGERDETYDLISVLYHALQGAETCGTYLRDAEASDDEDLAEFFEDTRAEYVARATLAKQLLLSRLLEEQDHDQEVEDDDDFEDEDLGDQSEGDELADEDD